MKHQFIMIGLLSSTIWLFISCERPPLQSPASMTPVSVAGQQEAKEDWKVKWQTVLTRASKEGSVVVYGPPIPATRQAFLEAFQKAYPGIALEYTGMPGSLALPKIKAERRAGIEIVDLFIGATITVLDLREYIQPLKPFLILPEVKDPKLWWDDRLDFSDDAEEINLSFTLNVNSRIVYNSNLVNPSEIVSYWNLVEPKWKDKIIMWDPRVVGSGATVAAFWYLHPKLGMDYVRDFLKNNPVFTRDLRFAVESVARGKYSISVAPEAAAVQEFQKAGMPVSWAAFMKEGTYSSAGFGSVSVMNKAPHPNAAAVFLNWLLGKEGQTIWTTTAGYASRRLDAPASHISEAKRPVPGISYMPFYKEGYIKKREEATRVLNEIFAGPR